MVGDSSGAHILPALRVSRWEAARTQRLLTMAQVRLVLVLTIVPVVNLGICIDKTPNSWTGRTRRGICMEIEETAGHTTTGIIVLG